MSGPEAALRTRSFGDRCGGPRGDAVTGRLASRSEPPLPLGSACFRQNAHGWACCKALRPGLGYSLN